MATVNLFYDPVFRDGAFTANDPRVRAYAVQKTMRAMDLGAELGAKIFVLWGGREGTETDACRRPDEAVKRLREAVNYLCEYLIDRKYGYRFALEAKPNEPRGDIYMATTGAYLGFIPTLDHPELVGVNPEVAHEHMAGLNFMHAVAPGVGSRQAVPHRSERPGARPLRPGLPVRRRQPQVGVLPGQVPRGRRLRRAAPLRRARLPHRGLRRRKRFRARLHAHVPDPEGEGRALERRRGDSGARAGDLGRRAAVAKYSAADRDALLARAVRPRRHRPKGLGYEKLDQLTMEVLLGVR